MDIQKEFESNGWVKINNLVDEPLLKFLASYSYSLCEIKGSGDKDVPDSPSIYGDFALENFTEYIKERVESVVGRELLRTCCYLRSYKHGAYLKRHVDREACEVSVSLCLASDAGKRGNPLFISSLKNKVDTVVTNKGEGIVYLGHKCEHWREEFWNNKTVQLFMHYVYADGDYTHLENDSRTERFVVK